jgi:acetyl-CoA carboxylase biotin carboxylase subunit
VEHPVTELVTGLDLVAEQLRIAAGLPMTLTQQDQVVLTGAAIEVRINAEDPARGFKPCPGMITGWYPPGGPGIRIDSHAHAGYNVPPNYDSMIGKLIVYRPTRDEAIMTMRRALREFSIDGIETTIPLLRKILNHTRFRRSQIDTGFIESYILDT